MNKYQKLMWGLHLWSFRRWKLISLAWTVFSQISPKKTQNDPKRLENDQKETKQTKVQ